MSWIGRRSGAARTRSPGSSPRCSGAPRAGFTPDEVAAGHVRGGQRAQTPRAPRSGSCSRSAPTPTPAYDAARINEAFADRDRDEGALLEELPERLDRFHYDLVATTTFHADEAQACSPAACRWSRCSRARARSSSPTRSRRCRRARKVGLVCASQRGVENIEEMLRLSGATGVEILAASRTRRTELDGWTTRRT